MVAVANVAESGTPKRVSVPSVDAPTAVGTVPWWAVCAPMFSPTDRIAISAMTATIARPCRRSPTIVPNVRGSEKEMHSSRKISSQFVHTVGFSNGCAELTLAKPPPFVPRSLMTSWLAIGPPVSVCEPPLTVAIAW